MSFSLSLQNLLLSLLENKENIQLYHSEINVSVVDNSQVSYITVKLSF
ncbi:hypothetical protein [Myroides sp. LJL119]